MSNIFIQNPTGENVAVRITAGEGSQIINNGPDGAVIIENNLANICLSPDVVLPEPVINQTQPIGLEGKYVVKINGEFVPYLFNSVDLQKYFDRNNTNSAGISFDETLQQPNFTLKNLDKNQEVEVRIYSADKLNIVNSNADFTTLDLSEKSIGVRLTADYSIDCTGALNAAGILDAVINGGSNVVTNLGVKTAISSAIDLVNILKTDFGLNAFIFNDYIPSITIDAIYDSYLQSITVTGPAGHLVTTQTIAGLTVGSGTIDVDGTVTYSINEGMLANNTILRTFVTDISNVVEHNLIASFRVASGDANPEVPWFSITTNMTGQFDYMPIANDVTGNILIEYVGKETLEINLADHHGNYSIDPYPTTFKNGAEIWDVRVRFKNLNTPIYLDVSEADYIYNFYDNDATNIGYHLKSSGTTTALKVKQIPDVIPASLTNMNFMFGEAAGSVGMFEPGVINVVSGWDVSNVTSMEGTFYGTQESAPPISGWNTSKVANMTNMFAASTDISTDLSQWCVPLIASEPSGFGTVLTNFKPVWGTCPRGENVPVAVDEMYFTTTAGGLSFYGVAGDVITLNDGTVYTVLEDGNYFSNSVPAGKHKVKLVSERSNGYVGIDGEALIELNNFPTLSSIDNLNFCPNSESPNLIKVPTVLPSNITNISYMFSGATIFNQNINTWDVSNVTSMQGMFNNASSFNQDLSTWDVSKVANVTGMFNFTTAFNQDLTQWCVALIPTLPVIFALNSALIPANYPVWGTCPRGENVV